MNDYVIADTSGISIVLQSSGHVRGSTGRDIFGAARHVSSAQSASYLVGGVWGHGPPGNFKKKTLGNVVSSVSGKQVSVSQIRLEFTQILLKSKIVNGNRDKW